MRLSRVVIAAALAAAAGIASAGPTELGTGTGTYTFTDNNDKGWFVTLGPGTYDISSSVTSDGFDLTEVWLSTSKDHNSSSGNGNDLQVFTQNGSTDWST